MAHIANMQKDVTGKSGSSRPKPSNHAGLFLVVRNALAVRDESTRAPQALQQHATEILPRHLCWTAFGTFMVGVLCLLIK